MREKSRVVDLADGDFGQTRHVQTRGMFKRMNETSVAAMLWVFPDDHHLVLHLERLKVGEMIDSESGLMFCPTFKGKQR